MCSALPGVSLHRLIQSSAKQRNDYLVGLLRDILPRLNKRDKKKIENALEEVEEVEEVEDDLMQNGKPSSLSYEPPTASQGVLKRHTNGLDHDYDAANNGYSGFQPASVNAQFYHQGPMHLVPGYSSIAVHYAFEGDSEDTADWSRLNVQC